MCPYCSSSCILYGKSCSGNQRYRCKTCKRTHSKTYLYTACNSGVDKAVICLVKEGCGIRSISRILGISTATVIRKIIRISKSLPKPMIMLGKEYEVDEICTYLRKKSKPLWIVYALCRDTSQVIDFAVGCRTNKTLRLVTETLILSNATKVYTDKLQNYKWLLPREIHSITHHGTNHIERKNLSLRTHLKRLSRKTICFSKSSIVLSACLRIYFWSQG